MGRIYTVQFPDVAVTTAQDLFEIIAPTTCVLRILDWSVLQNTDTGDAEEEILRLETVYGDGSVTSGSGGSSVTPEPAPGDSAASFTCEANNTTRMAAGTGTLRIKGHFGWNIRGGFEKIYTPETCPEVSPSDRWTLSLAGAPADPITVSGHVTVEEIGG